ncbi:RICIN domain-containing protein [Streptomyces sp. TRM68367]|uniref:RICIN domain-containing protein n=1 Tax=Streptomyces sp. TRM68367 TaxID=2758415 RepID=UPI002934ABB4|nr:RICIN domain-containing protein [Streptomyces sp. TRM68367]
MSPGESDGTLLARSGDGGDGARAVALLLARHWRAVYEYAVICLAATADSAPMAVTAAFHRELGRPAGGALRPRLLQAVRDMVGQWADDDSISGALPELRKPTGARGLRAARSATPEKRRLAKRAFEGLPGASQCLLWHTEVEAEPISVPAGLLGVDDGTAAAALEQAREQFRVGCVRAHRELAPSTECRFYNRLLDVPMRRGGALLPDVRRHLAACRYCRHAAEQLSYFEGGLEALLAETVLGWGARRYLDSRPGRGGTEPGPPGSGMARLRGSGRHRPASAGRLLAPARRHTKAVALGVGLSLALLATVLAARGWSDERGTAAPGATWGAPASNSVRPGDPAGPRSGGVPSAAPAGNSAEVAHGRLRNSASGLCLDARDGRAEAGAAVVLAGCSSAGSQQWSYQEDGLLRSAADPTLCLTSDADAGTVGLAGCLVHAGHVRYDLTVRGELLLRGGKGLVVAPGGTQVVVTRRDGSEGQRWLLETDSANGGGGPGKGAGETFGQRGDTSGQQGRAEEAPQGSRPQKRSGDAPLGDEPHRPAPEDPSQTYEKRFAQVGSGTEPADSADPADAVRTLAVGAADPVASTVTGAVPGLRAVLH